MKKLRYIYLHMLGFLSFFISQIMLRIPLLNFLAKNPGFVVFQLQNALFVGCLIAISAGVFEEVFRFLFRRFLIRDSIKIAEPVIFGLGHSLMEIIYIFTPVVLASGLSVISPLAVVERLFATLLHIEFSIIIWNGFLANKKYSYLFLAILLHSLCDIIIPIAGSLGVGICVTEILFLLVVAVTGVISLKINRLEWKL